MTYQIIITEETAANIVIDNNTTNVNVSTSEYPIVIEYNAVVEQAGGNAYGNANVAGFMASFGANTISTTGNITGGNISGTFVGSIANAVYANTAGVAYSVAGANVSGTVANATFATSAGTATSATTAGTVTTAAQANITSVGILTSLSASGNITGNYILGNGSQLTGLPATYGNANVVANIAALGSNPVSTTGNITAGYFVGNGSQLTGLGATYSNANATSLLASFGSNAISTTGNVTAGYVIGNGSALTNITGGNVTGSVAQANQANTANAVAGANVSGQVANALVAGTVYTAAQPNITSVGILTSASVTGNITGGLFVGNGAGLTNINAGNIVGSYGNANVANFLGSFGSNTISTTGNITSGNLNVQVDAVITGNLTVNGTTTTVNSNTVTINDKFINVANNAATAAAANGGGLGVGPVGGEYATLTYNSTNNDWNTNIALSVAGNVTGSYFLGNGSQLTGLPVQPGTYGNANVVANIAALGTNPVSTTGNVTAGYVIGNGSLLSSITGANVTGTVANATFATSAGSATTATTAGTVTSNAQANITSVGVLTSLSVAGNVDLGSSGQMVVGVAGLNNTTIIPGEVTATKSTGLGRVTADYLFGNGSNISAIAGANVTGTVANATFATSAGSATTATFADTANAVAGANVSGTVANATYATSAGSATTATTANTADTVTGNAQANITSVGTLTSLSVSGNITGSNVNASTVQATTSAGLSLKNSAGTTQASLGAGGGDNFTISVSTNITGANAQIDISPTGNSGHVHIKPTGTPSVEIAPTYTGSINNMIIGNITPAAVTATTVTATGNITGGNVLTAGVVSAGGNITGGNLLTGGIVSATGNVTGNYFIGNGSQLTGITASANAAGSNTQIQYNNGGAFAGNPTMTFDNTVGNVQLSNMIIGSNPIGNLALGNAAVRMNTQDAYTGTTVANNGFLSGQIVIGNGFFGNLNLNNIQARPTGKFNVWDSANVSEVSGNSIRYQALNGSGMLSIGNVANTASLVRGGVGTLAIGGGPSANVWSATAQGMGAVLAFNQFLAVGQPNTVAALGNVTLTGAAAALGQSFVYAGSNVGNLAGVNSQINNAGNVTTAIGMSSQLTGTPTTTPTNSFGFYMPGTTNLFGLNNSNGMRQATNYYFLRNDDAVAQNQLGSLRAYHTFQAGGNTTGTWNIDKASGQVQAVSATGNITIGTYTNFVTTANDGTNNDSQTDTVTLIIEQGATPYTVTMPTGNAAIRYANGVSTVTSTANTTTMINITAFRSAANATSYLTTISPAFS